MEDKIQEERRPKGGERKDTDREPSAKSVLTEGSKRFRFDDWASI